MKTILSSFLLAVIIGFSTELTSQETFEYGGEERFYYLDVPDNLEPGAPLVFVMHGYTSSAFVIRNYSGWSAISEEDGVVVCYPQGTQDSFFQSHWNANLGISEVDDISFLVALAEYLQETYNLSTDCTYACGMSNGGYMSYSLACEAPETFRAIGSVTGAMSAYDFQNCDPSTVVPVIHLHGTSDFVVSYDGGVDDPNWGSAGVPEIIDLWTGMMGTTDLDEIQLPNQEIIDLTSVDFLRYHQSPGGQEFHHYRVNNGGHDWFGSWGSEDVESTEVLWHFFQLHCGGQFTSVEESLLSPSLAFWDGATFGLFETADLYAYDLQGRLLWERIQVPQHTRINVEDLSGVALIRVRSAEGNVSVVRIR